MIGLELVGTNLITYSGCSGATSNRAIMVHGMLKTNSQRNEYMFGSYQNGVSRVRSGMPGGDMIGLEFVGTNLITYSGCSGATSNRAVMVHGMLKTNSQRNEYMFGSAIKTASPGSGRGCQVEK